MTNVFEQDGPLMPGDVVLWFAGPTDTSCALGTWLQTIAQDARLAAEQVPVIVIGLDRSIMGEKSVARVLEELGKTVGDPFPIPRLIELSTEEGEQCLTMCPFAEPNAIVVILDVERLRFGGVEPAGPQVESVDGAVIRISEKDDVSLPHVTRLCDEICAAAPAHGQKWLIVSRGYGFSDDVPATLIDRENLQCQLLSEESHDPSLVKDLRDLLANLPYIGAENAINWVSDRLPAGKVATIVRANILSLIEQPVQAYRAISSVSAEILRDGQSEEIIQLAQMALSAGLTEDSIKWIGHLPPVGMLELENLRAARLLAFKLGASSLRRQCMVEFLQRFPNHPMTQLDRFNELINAGDYGAARQQAEETGHPFRKEVALFMASPTDPPEALLKAAEAAGETYEAYWTIAKSAKKRKDYSVCREYLRLLSDDDWHGGDAVAMRIRILGAQIPDIEEKVLHQELRAVLTWCAKHPTELEARFALEALIDSTSTEKACLTHTLVVLNTELERLTRSFDLARISLRAAIEHPMPSTESETLELLFTELFAASNIESVVVGTARLTPQQAALISPELWSDLGHCLSFVADAGDPTMAVRLLHIIMAVARETHDPASDLLASRQVVSSLAISNSPQQALDLAESLLTLLPANHNDYKGWRLSMAWLVYADASLRLGNVHAGIRFVCFACLCLDEEPQHARLFLEMFRTAARAARDARIPPLALRFLDLEEKLLESLTAYKRRFRELQQMVLSIELTTWSPMDGLESLWKILQEALDLLDQGDPDEEVAPLLSIAAQAAQIHAAATGTTSHEVRKRVDQYLAKLTGPSRSTIGDVMREQISVDLLRSLATRTIRASDDWSVSLSPALVAARKALSQACKSGDAELFWTASLIICQPGLSVRVSEQIDSNPHADPVAAMKWMGKQINAGRGKPLDAVLVQRALSNSSKQAVGERLFEISLTDLVSLIEPHETVVLLVSDNERLVYRLELRRDGVGRPTRVPEDEWDADRFNAWSREYPAKYGHDLGIHFGTVYKPPVAEVSSTLLGLLPAGRFNRSIATVVAEGRLFNFSHHLASHLAGNSTSVAVCPSARWLGSARRELPPLPTQPVAWLGSPSTSDADLKDLQSVLTPVLKNLHVELSIAKAIPDLRRRQFVVLGSHGQALNSEGFGRLTDCEEAYEPDQVASALSGTQCVVLFVCHGGRGDERLFSHEIHGLTSSLLRHGVRTVVAAQWPLYITCAVAWLEEFGKTNPSDTIVERVDVAQHEMAKRSTFASVTGEHPLVRCTFTVFGDGCVRVNFPDVTQ